MRKIILLVLLVIVLVSLNWFRALRAETVTPTQPRVPVATSQIVR